MTLRWSEIASADLLSIYDYIAHGNPDAASRTIETIIETAEKLLEHPKLGKPGSRNGTRELIKPPFIIFYRLLEEVISVETVLHGSIRRDS